MANRTSINKSELFKHAWRLYCTPSYAGAKIPTKFHKLRFANCLKQAWSNARYEALPVAVKVERLEAEKAALQYKPFGHRIGDEVASLDLEISQLQKAA